MGSNLVWSLVLILAGFAAMIFWMRNRRQVWEAEHHRALQQSQLASHAMQHTMDGIMILGADRRILFINKGFVDITGYSAEEVIGHKPRMLHSTKHDEKFYKDLGDALRQKGCWKGEIGDERKDGQAYTQLLSLNAVRDTTSQKVTHYIGTFADISQYKDYESALEFLANHDPLTNLPNRMLFNDRLDDAIVNAARNKTRICVIFIDLDRFKIINDSLGHEIGDRLLQEIAARLQAGVPPCETLARLGGDEFTIVLEQAEDRNTVILLAENLLAAIEKPAVIDAHELFVSASIGISFYPQDGQDATTLLKHADTAMYRAKEEGRDKIKLFAPEMNLRAKEFMVMANSLHVALERGQFTVEYQPRVDLATGKIIGVEALIRWKHPELGSISPEKFIPLAEETGLILPIGEWVLQTACRQGQIWRDAGYPLLIAVNLSLRQFGRPGLVAQILETVRAAAYSTDLLEV
ncbi:MAG: diguanylate cyclase, partial [Proteobacteria bacterium]|nr:diguanylate cyclase [Pseudomonadota bacterium]